ncbi:MAG: hypothetical protein KC493_03665 [Bacteriovoracaceae bacterium]|nr:hypothetical protein [Bacteriovoracaceae bacterium]
MFRTGVKIQAILLLVITLMATSCNVQEKEKSKVVGQNANAPTQTNFSITSAPTGVNENNNTAFPILGVCSEVGNVIELRFGPLVQTSSCQSNLSWSFSLNLTLVNDGAINFTLIEHRPNGKKPIVTHTAYKDSTDPVITGLTDQLIRTNSKTFTWGCSETCTYRFVITTSGSFNPTGAYTSSNTYTDTVRDGFWKIRVQAQDVAGNESAVYTANYWIDITAPNMTGMTNNSTPTKSTTWNWACSDNWGTCQTRFVVDQNPTTTPTGAYNGTLTTTQNTGDGTWYLHIQTQDDVGNESPVEHYSTVLDNTPPASSATINGLGSSPTIDTADRTITVNAPGDATHYKAANTTAANCSGVAWGGITEQVISSSFNMVLDEGNTHRFCLITRDTLNNWQVVPQEFPIVVNFPSGMLIPYQLGACPTGWTEFTAARGRALIGAGVGNNNGFGQPLSSRTWTQSGGLEKTSGIPANTNAATTQTPSTSLVFRTANFNYLVNAASANTTLDFKITDSNMAPYLVVRYCRKN